MRVEVCLNEGMEQLPMSEQVRACVGCGVELSWTPKFKCEAQCQHCYSCAECKRKSMAELVELLKGMS